MAVAGVLSVILLGGCIGTTEPPTDLRSTRVDLHARGHTNNGPASWWWEYGEVRRGVVNGQGTKTPRQGPASSAADVYLTWRLNALDPGQRYYYRACGQDQAAGSGVACGRIYEFTTAPGDSQASGTPDTQAAFTGATSVRHDLRITNVGLTVTFREVANEYTDPPTGSFIGSTTCSTVATGMDYVNAVNCSHSLQFPQVRVTLGPYADTAVSTAVQSVEIDGGGGNDALTGGPGADILRGGSNDDILKGGGATDEFHCGPGNDTAYGTSGELLAAEDCETLVVE